MGIQNGFQHWAFYYKSKGFNPVPCRSGEKAPLGSWALFQINRVSDQQIVDWATEDDTRNIGSVAGTTTNYCIVDVDDGGFDTLTKLGITIPDNTPVVLSGGVSENGERNRYHIYYTITGNEALLDGISRIAELFGAGCGVEFRIKNCFTVLPPSIHVTTGHAYEWYNGQTPDMGFAELPVWVTDAVKTHVAVKPDSKVIDMHAPINDGNRDDTLYDIAHRMYRASVDKADCYTAINNINNTRVFPPEHESDITRIVESAYKPNKRDGRRMHKCNDDGNAQRYFDFYKDDTKFNFGSKSFVHFNGKFWEEDDVGTKTHERCLFIVNRIPDEVPEDAETSIKTAYNKFSTKSGNTSALNSMKEAIEKRCTVKDTAFDHDKWLFNVANGTVNLRTGELYPHKKEDMLSKCSGVVYDRSALCPRFTEFMNQISVGDASLIQYLQVALGYSLSGDTDEQKMFILQGTGGNGKSTLMRVVSTMMGNMSCQPRIDTLCITKYNDTGRNDLANMRGARLVNAAEPNKGSFLDLELIYKMTGGENINCRHLYNKKEFSYPATYKIFMQCNHLPNVQDTGDSACRRFRVIPFRLRVAERDRDEQLVEKLLAESSGILNWLIEGCLYRVKHGRLPDCDAVKDASNEYMEDQDPVGKFLKYMMEDSPGAQLYASEIHTAFAQWASKGETSEFKPATITKCIKEKGYRTKHGDRGTQILGLKFRSVSVALPHDGTF